MTAPLIDGQKFLKLINTTNHVALDKACLIVSGRGMLAAKASMLSCIGGQLIRAMRETQNFHKEVERHNASLQSTKNF